MLAEDTNAAARWSFGSGGGLRVLAVDKLGPRCLMQPQPSRLFLNSVTPRLYSGPTPSSH